MFTMSKITPKNLQYDGSLPPFLARLQANNNTRDGRHEFSVARPKKERTAEDDAEDEPVYYDEATGESLSKSEWEERDKGATNSPDRPGTISMDETEDRSKNNEKEPNKEKAKLAAIGATKKRKAGKIIGGDDPVPNVNDTTGAIAQPLDLSNSQKVKGEKPKAAKKGKKVKLSFNDDE